MTSSVNELYQEMILEHYKNPRNYGPLASANHMVEGFNPLCGDHYKLYCQIDGDTIKDVHFEGSGCAISKASASMMTASVKGKSKKEAEALFDHFHQMISGNARADKDKLGKLIVFSGVSEFPMRVKCANLAWHALRAAIRGEGQTVSTE